MTCSLKYIVYLHNMCVCVCVRVYVREHCVYWPLRDTTQQKSSLLKRCQTSNHLNSIPVCLIIIITIYNTKILISNYNKGMNYICSKCTKLLPNSFKLCLLQICFCRTAVAAHQKHRFFTTAVTYITAAVIQTLLLTGQGSLNDSLLRIYHATGPHIKKGALISWK